MGHGMSTTFLFGKEPIDTPQIPCDLVTNSILVIAMVTARLPEPQFNIFHCSSNAPDAFVNTYDFLHKAADYLKYNPYDSAISENIGCRTVQTVEDWRRYRFYKYDIAAKAMQLASKLPLSGSKKLHQQSKIITMLADRMENISLSYWFFFKQSWLFDHEKYYKVCDSLNEFDKQEFFMDHRKIDLSEGGINYAHGLAKYYLLEDIPALDSGLKQVVQMN
jgi:hypothetical protein